MILLGTRGERAAARAIKHLGYRVVARNFRCPAGEIDLIAVDGDAVVFIEVKTRRSAEVAFPEANVTPTKKRKLSQVARYYLAAKGIQDRPCRFDVVSVVWNEGKKPSIEHFINAFGPIPR